jgi:hypothetical protein
MLADVCERNMTGLKSLGEDCTHRKQRRSKSMSRGLYIYCKPTIQNSEKNEQIRHEADADLPQLNDCKYKHYIEEYRCDLGKLLVHAQIQESLEEVRGAIECGNRIPLQWNSIKKCFF